METPAPLLDRIVNQ